MKKGDIVKIYEHPLSEEKFEGMAKLLTFIREFDPGIEYWKVKFFRDGFICERTIKVK